MKFTERMWKSLLLAGALVLLVGVSNPEAKAANLVQNGGFETTSLSSPGGYFCSAGAGNTCLSNVANWTSTCTTSGPCGDHGTPTSVIFPGTGGSAFNGGFGFTAASSNSPNGGNYVAADADGTNHYSSTISQTITGLTAGTSYLLTFYQASDQQSGSNSPFTLQWQVNFGGAATQFSQVITNPGGAFTPWTQQSLVFKADSTTDVLSFLAVSPSGAPPVALLDGVSLTATPEAATSYLAFSAFLALALFARFRQRRNQA